MSLDSVLILISGAAVIVIFGTTVAIMLGWI